MIADEGGLCEGLIGDSAATGRDGGPERDQKSTGNGISTPKPRSEMVI